MSTRWSSRWSSGKVSGLAAALTIAAVVPAVALAHGTAKIPGNAKAGKPIFVSTCGVCHTLKAAKSAGKIGPNLNNVKLTDALLIKAITHGGSSVMSKKAAAAYATHMVAYKGVLSTAQIQNVAAFVYGAMHA